MPVGPRIEICPRSRDFLQLFVHKPAARGQQSVDHASTLARRPNRYAVKKARSRKRSMPVIAAVSGPLLKSRTTPISSPIAKSCTRTGCVSVRPRRIACTRWLAVVVKVSIPLSVLIVTGGTQPPAVPGSRAAIVIISPREAHHRTFPKLITSRHARHAPLMLLPVFGRL